jgi:hypothetical protein
VHIAHPTKRTVRERNKAKAADKRQIWGRAKRKRSLIRGLVFRTSSVETLSGTAHINTAKSKSGQLAWDALMQESGNITQIKS